MKFSTAKEHRDFFQKQGWIEFEGLISNSQLLSVNQAIDQVLAKRLDLSIEALSLLPTESLYLQGHDLWRSDALLQKFATQIQFAKIATELIEKKALRLGCDQFFPSLQEREVKVENASIYTKFLDRAAALEDVCCLQGIACALLVCLKGSDISSEEKLIEGADIFPRQAGHIIFFQPHLLVNWKNFYAHLGQRYYLIVYASPLTYYQFQPQDPHTHALKRLGYIFNDKLSDKLNPMIQR